ncbi:MULTISPECIES: molybdate ABC transporter substrate-binding protein [unclassified Devosia]|uniref:molybdate ABC transporter substrate-binding protein n=1 Tax=unclassified Devosia TaxID=196773 RepID=UPI00155366E9|nr:MULTISPECIES: molybdate ABC transporter substrate-binding protein [unclassified Devosia]
MKRMVLVVAAWGALLVGPAQAELARIAVAANFTSVAEQLAPVFTAQTGHQVQFSFGATGLLYGQITQGAPFDVLLAADDERPARAVDKGFGVEGSVFSYATGVLALYSTTLDVTDGRAALGGGFEKLAIADPQAAPYGQGAVETLRSLGVYDALQPKLVLGENISQALQFVQTGNAELGFVGLSQVQGQSGVWIVPSELYTPIRQDAVLLKLGADNRAATAFLEFLRSDEAVALIEAAGYRIER